MIFAARQLQEKCQEQPRHLSTTFGDLTKAFGTICRDEFWKITAKCGISEKVIAIVKSFHEGMLARVIDERESSETIQVTNGIRQGCVLAPTFFSVDFSAMLKTAFHDDTDSMVIRYRTGGKLFNLRRLQARTKVKEETVHGILFADDCALNASSDDEMQRNTDKVCCLPATPLDSPLAQRKRRSCFCQHHTQTTQIQPSQSRARSCKL